MSFLFLFRNLPLLISLLTHFYHITYNVTLHYNLPLFVDFYHITYHVTFHYNLPLYVEWMGWGDDGNFYVENTFRHYKTRTCSSTLSARCVSTFFYFLCDFIGHTDVFVTRFIYEKRDTQNNIVPHLTISAFVVHLGDCI